MTNTHPVLRRQFLKTTAECLAGAALLGIARPFSSMAAAEQLPASAPGFLPWVSSDVATLRRVIISPPDHDEGLNLIDPSFGLEPWVDREDWLKDHAVMRALLEKSGAEVLTFEGVLDEAIEAARAKGEFRTWLRASLPALSSEEKKVTAAELMGAARERLYPQDEDGNFRYLVDADTVTWPRDVAVMLPAGLLICNFISERRVFLAQLMRFVAEYSPSLTRYPVAFDAIEEQVLVEGGDVQVMNGDTLLMGVGYRSEPSAARHLARRLGMNVIAVQLRKADYVKRPPKEAPLGLATMFMHLDTCCTHVNDKHVIVLPWFLENEAVGKNPFVRVLKGIARHPHVKEEDAEEALSWLVEMGKVKRYLAGSGEVDPKVTDLKLVDYLRAEGYRISYVGGPPPPDADMDYFFDVVWREHLFQAANVVATSPGHILSYDHCPKTHEALRAAGIDVKVFPGANLRRGYGGPHCLTLPLERG
jgi:arginine deiminase